MFMGQFHELMRMGPKELEQCFPRLPIERSSLPPVNLLLSIDFGAYGEEANEPAVGSASISQEALARLYGEAGLLRLSVGQLACGFFFHPYMRLEEAAARLGISEEELALTAFTVFKHDCYKELALEDLALIYWSGRVQDWQALERLEMVEE